MINYEIVKTDAPDPYPSLGYPYYMTVTITSSDNLPKEMFVINSVDGSIIGYPSLEDFENLGTTPESGPTYRRDWLAVPVKSALQMRDFIDEGKEYYTKLEVLYVWKNEAWANGTETGSFGA